MRSFRFVSLLVFVSAAFTQSFSRSAKRGLPYAPSPLFPQDNQIWVRPGSDLTWYYNYIWSPSPAFSNIPQSQFEFVPMIWGAPANDDDFMFLNNTGLGHKTEVTMSVSAAVHAWKRQVEPLKDLGIKLGAPVTVTQRQSGLDYFAQFMAACTNCTMGFIPVHYYGNYSGFVDLIETMHTLYPTPKLWITEYGYAHVALQPTQDFFNKSAVFLDNADYIERYSWFGAFRSNQSNVGANGCFLTPEGKLTDIGSWYLGGSETNNIPSGAFRFNFAGMKFWAMVTGVLFVHLILW